MIDVPSRLTELIDLPRAWRRVWRDRSTDFVVPPLAYTAINARADEFLALLGAELDSGRYRPSSVRVFEVPKPNHTTRPAGILDIKDRILYQALVDRVAAVADSKLLREPTVFGFRVNTDDDSDRFLLPGGFSEFRERVAVEHTSGHSYLLESDISAYFECIEPRILQEAVLDLGVNASLAEVLTRLLEHWNRLIPIGLPQGAWPSDFLGARVYLDRVDKAMLLKRHRFFRYSDDIRVAAKSRLALRLALKDLVVQLRAVGLHVQSAKTKILGPQATERSIRRLHERLARREDLAQLLDLDPYGYTSAEETLLELTETEITQSESLLDALMEEAYGDGSAPDFELCRTCITGYRRIKSVGGLDKAIILLSKLPAMTRDLVRYLRLICASETATRIKNSGISVLRHNATIYGWQKHWLLYLLNAPPISSRLSPGELEYIFGLSVDRNVEWPVRVMAIRVLGTRGDDAKLRELKNLYEGESDVDVRHAVLAAISRLSRPQVRSFYRLCEGADSQTDIVIAYQKGRLSM